jgi:uncharacterized protein YbjT (DUF2867 family)
MNHQKKILIIGAHGKIGQLLTEKLSKNEAFAPTAFIRKESQTSIFKDMGVDTMIGDLEDSISNLTKKFDGFDAVVFTAGSGGETGADKTLTIDLEGAIRSIKASESSSVERFILVSVAGSDNREVWNESGMKPYFVAKHYADVALKYADLDYSIVRPVQLTDDEETGKIMAKPTYGGLNQKISRADVANVIVEIIDRKDTFKKIIEISSGEESIEDAVSSAVSAEMELA